MKFDSRNILIRTGCCVRVRCFFLYLCY